MRVVGAVLALALASLMGAAPAAAGPLDCNSAEVLPIGDPLVVVEVCPLDPSWSVSFEGAGQALLASDCAGDANGVFVAVNGAIAFACVTVDIEPPSGLPDPGLPGMGAASCNTGEVGVLINIRTGVFAGTTVGLCFVYSFQMPHDFSDPDPRVSLKDCGMGSADPAIGIFGGGVAFCLKPVIIIDPTLPGGPDPPAGVSVDPCESGADPTIFIGDGSVAICFEVQVPL